MRFAIRADSQRLLAWRNHENVRRYSRNIEKIDWDVHQEWFEDKLDPSKSNSKIFIFLQADLYVGMSRLDSLSEDSGEISILVDPALQGKGYGFKILRQCIEYAFTESKYLELEALIHSENSASQALFSKCGFVKLRKVGLFESYKLSK